MVHELNSPLSKHFVNRLREKETDAAMFRTLIRHLTLLLADAALSDSEMHPRPLETWQGQQTFDLMDESAFVVVTVLRAGLPMLDAAVDLFPNAQAGFLAMKRDETTHHATLYYDRVPDCEGKHVIVVDPMIATGGSLKDAVALLKEKRPAKITSLNIIAAPEGLENVMTSHPDLSLFVAKIDARLNAQKYIIPGLGDAGDRAYNTL